MNLFKKLIFLLDKPPVIIVVGRGRLCAKEAISKMLSSHFHPHITQSSGVGVKGNDFLIFESDLQDYGEIKKSIFLLNNSSLPVLVITHTGEIPLDYDFFTGEKKDSLQIRKLAESLDCHGFIISNFDDETAREIRKKSIAHSLTFGLQKGADFRATDINFDMEGTNFKINHEEKIMPFWLKGIFGKEQIYSVLSAVCLGTAKKMNLIEISMALKSYQSLPGKMRLIEGIKKTLILDDSDNADLFSMIEGLKILNEIGGERRKVAVLGDVLKLGKYTIEAHEAIGERVARDSDLLFAVGPRAKFIVQGAKSKGMEEKNIFQFDRVEEAKLVVQKEIKKGDLILVDGSREMKMGEIVNEIKNL